MKDLRDLKDEGDVVEQALALADTFLGLAPLAAARSLVDLAAELVREGNT